MNSPAEIAKNYIAVGKAKTSAGFWKLLILGMLAGAFIGFAGVGATVAGLCAPGTSGRFLGACVFPAGLSMVLLAGSELFTGNSLLVIPVLTGDVRFSAMLRNWAVVYAGNFLGSLLVAALAVFGHTGDLLGGIQGGVAASRISAAVNKVSLSFGDAFLRGVCCNFLVCVAVWISFAARDVAGKVLGLFLPIMLFVVCGFEHSIANMYYIPCGLFCKALYGAEAEALTWGAFFLKNLIPVTLGNLVGGVGLVGLPYWFVYLRDNK